MKDRSEGGRGHLISHDHAGELTTGIILRITALPIRIFITATARTKSKN